MNVGKISSCENCIWHDQCKNVVPCEYYDEGRLDDLPDESEIELLIETRRIDFIKSYNQYLQDMEG